MKADLPADDEKNPFQQLFMKKPAVQKETLKIECLNNQQQKQSLNNQKLLKKVIQVIA